MSQFTMPDSYRQQQSSQQDGQTQADNYNVGRWSAVKQANNNNVKHSTLLGRRKSTTIHAFGSNGHVPGSPTTSNGYIPTLDDSSCIANSGQVSPEEVIRDDLRAFENRLNEIVAFYRPKSMRYRWILCSVMLLTVGSALAWLLDPATLEMTFLESLASHKLFAFNCLLLLSLFLAGYHKRVVAQFIIVARIREVIGQFNMNCDDNGRLLLMPQPNYLNGFHR